MNLRAVRWRLLVGVAIGVGGAVAGAAGRATLVRLYGVEAWHDTAGHGGAGHGAAGAQPLIVPLRRTANDAIGAP